MAGPDTPPSAETPSAETVGQRVTIRYRISDDTGFGATDVVGQVESVGTVISVRRRDNSLVVVDPADIVIWRIVPQ